MPSESAAEGADLLYSAKAFEEAVKGSSNTMLRVDDFELGRTIGKGRYARVRMAKLKANAKIPLCLKILKKKDVHRLDQVTHIINEKDVIASSKHPFIIQLLQTFQDPIRLYMALELVNGGELFSLLRSQRQFKFPMARFYIAEMSSAISYLHEMLVVFRDIKPENILIHRSGHLKLTDFGFAKYLKDEKTFTVCGTASYMAPEVIKVKAGYGLPVDWWGIGILTFELLSGRPPFDADNEAEIFRKILKGHTQYPPTMEKPARDFIMRLLTIDPLRRLGSYEGHEANFRDHAFFEGISWQDVEAGRLEPPWKPNSDGDFDTSLFDRFEESAGGAGGIDSCTASSFLAKNEEDPFSKWTEVHTLREEGLKAAQDAREKRERRREQRRKEKEAQAQEVEKINKERDQLAEKTAEPVKPLAKEPTQGKQAQSGQSCCTMQ